MKKTEVAIRPMDSILDEVSAHFDEIRRRAFEIFNSAEGSMMGELDHWLAAERELSMEPSLEVRRADGKFEIDATLPGVDPKDLDVQVTSEDVLIQTKRLESKEADAGAGDKAKKAEKLQMENVVQLFRAVHLPLPINPDGVKADYKEGVLHLTAPIVEPVMRKIEIHA